MTEPTQADAATVTNAIQTALDAIVSLENSGQLSYMEADAHHLPTARNMLLDAKAKLAPILQRAEAQAYYAGAKAMRDVCAQIAKDQSREMGNQQWELAADQIYENIIVAEVLKP